MLRKKEGQKTGALERWVRKFNLCSREGRMNFHKQAHVMKQDWGVISQVTFESVERTESEKAVGRRLDESLMRVKLRCSLEH